MVTQKVYRWAVALVAVIAFATGLGQPILAGAPPDVTVNEVYSFEDGSIKGVSVLRRTDRGASMTLYTSDLPPGAYTVWWVVFNHPEKCDFFPILGPGSCGLDSSDFAVGGPAGFGFTWAAGGIVNRHGKAVFAGHIKEGTLLLNDDLDRDELFEDARSAEIHLIVRYHGPVDPKRIWEQTHTLEPELGLEADLQFSVHAAK